MCGLGHDHPVVVPGFVLDKQAELCLIVGADTIREVVDAFLEGFSFDRADSDAVLVNPARSVVYQVRIPGAQGKSGEALARAFRAQRKSGAIHRLAR